MNYIKITCPCHRPHNKRYDDQVSYVEEDCNKVVTWIGVESELCHFAHFCTDCKKTIEGVYDNGQVTLTVSKNRIQEINNPMVITYE